jgi:hypothetical protein
VVVVVVAVAVGVEGMAVGSEEVAGTGTP